MFVRDSYEYRNGNRADVLYFNVGTMRRLPDSK